MNVLLSDAGARGSSPHPERGSALPLAAEVEGSSVLQQYFRLALRRRWVIAGAVAAAIALGLIVTLLMTPQYTAESTIEISRESDQVTDFQGVERDVSVADQEFYQTQYGLLRTRTLAERVAVAMRLVDDPQFFEMFRVDVDGPAFEQRAGRYGTQGRSERQRVAGEVLLEHVTISPTRLSRLVDIQFTSPHAELSAQIANSWAENFIELNLERKVQSTAYGRSVLQRQLAEFKDRLDESQRQLVTYASEEEIINIPSPVEGGADRSIVAENLAKLNVELTDATADRIRAEARVRQASRSGGSVEALSNSAINNLRQRRAELAANYRQMLVVFEPNYPAAQALQKQVEELDQAIAREENRVTDSLQTDYLRATQREKMLSAKVAGLKEDFLDLRRRSIQYNIFQQEVDTNQALYDGLLQRFKEIGVAGGVGVNNIAVVDRADVPQEPSSPRLVLNFLIAIVAGLALGFGGAFAFDQFDETIGDPGELQRRLGLPLLGTVPKIEKGTPQDALKDRKSDLVDAYLAVQTTLSFATENGIPRVFSVTSTRPAEGKSTTALALATMLARSGRRTILIDGDMRSPSVHQLAGVDHNRGLSNYLAGDDAIEGLVLSMEDMGIDIMTAGPIPPNAAELLTSNRLSLMVERLLGTYDQIVIDSPPVLGLADAPLIGMQVDGVVYAIEAHGIRAGQAKTALARLISANVRILGGVVTKYNPQKAYDGYNYNYEYKYGSSDNDIA